MALKKVEKRRKRISFIILLVISIIFMIPLIWAVATSFKSAEDITYHITSLIPYNFTFENYIKLFNDESMPIFKWLGNSAFVAVTHTFIYLIFASMAGYAFGVLQWKGRDKVFWLLLLTSPPTKTIYLLVVIFLMKGRMPKTNLEPYFQSH